jgi:hypothetical protein
MLSTCIGDNFKWFGLVLLQNQTFTHQLKLCWLLYLLVHENSHIGPWKLKIAEICYLFDGLCCLYVLETI